MSILRRRYRGLSLVEILITLAILLIGILAVLRIFPRGLGTLTHVSDRQEAIRLAEARMNELQAAADRLPDYILPAGRPTDTVPFSDPPTNSVPNPGFGFLSQLTGTEAHRPYDLDLPFADSTDSTLLHRLGANNRLVVGERVLVGRRTDGSSLATTARPYHTLFGPIGNCPKVAPADPDVLGLAVFRNFTRVSAAELQRTQVSGAYRDRPVFCVVDGGIDDFTRQPAADRLLFELDGTDRVFSVRCAYRDDYGTIQWAQLQPVVVPTEGYPSNRMFAEAKLIQPQAPNRDITQVIPGSVQVRQVLAAGGGASPSRFRYGTGNAGHGVLYFAASQAGETLSLEYIVEDWRNLREQVTVQVDGTGLITSITGGRLQLAARNLDENFVPRLVVLATGHPLTIDQAAWQADPALARGGVIPIDPANAANTLEAVAGPQEVAVFYRRTNNWLVAPSMAPSSYLLTGDASGMSSGGQASNFPVQSLLVDTAAVTGAASYTELLFRPSEAGRSVAVTYEYDPGDGSRQIAAGELHVIPTQANRNIGGNDRHAIVLRRPNVLSDSNARLRILAIEGRSLQLRTCYDEDTSGRPAQPVQTTPAPGTTYNTAERLIELTTYVRRNR